MNKFLAACSNVELQEIDLLLSSYLNPNKKPDFKEPLFAFEQELKQLLYPDDYNHIKAEIYKIKSSNRVAFITLLKMGFIPEAALKAMPIIDNIQNISPLQASEVVNLMREFMALENLRMISVVKKPQLINKSESYE